MREMMQNQELRLPNSKYLLLGVSRRVDMEQALQLLSPNLLALDIQGIPFDLGWFLQQIPVSIRIDDSRDSAQTQHFRPIVPR